MTMKTQFLLLSSFKKF